MEPIPLVPTSRNDQPSSLLEIVKFPSASYKRLRKALLSNFRFKVGYLVEIFRFGCHNSKYIQDMQNQLGKTHRLKNIQLDTNWIRILQQKYLKMFCASMASVELQLSLRQRYGYVCCLLRFEFLEINYEGGRDLEFSVKSFSQ